MKDNGCIIAFFQICFIRGLFGVFESFWFRIFLTSKRVLQFFVEFFEKQKIVVFESMYVLTLMYWNTIKNFKTAKSGRFGRCNRKKEWTPLCDLQKKKWLRKRRLKSEYPACLLKCLWAFLLSRKTDIPKNFWIIWSKIQNCSSIGSRPQISFVHIELFLYRDAYMILRSFSALCYFEAKSAENLFETLRRFWFFFIFLNVPNNFWDPSFRFR